MSIPGALHPLIENLWKREMHLPIDPRVAFTAVICTSILSIILSILLLSSGFSDIAQILFFIPIILACLFYLRQGLIYSIFLSLLYLIILLSTAGVEHLVNGVFRVLIFFIVGVVVTFLMEGWMVTERGLRARTLELNMINEMLRQRNDQLLALEAEMQANRDEIQRMQRELLETNDFLNNLISYTNAPIVVWDSEGKITRFNKAFEHLSGIPAEEAIGSDLGILFRSENCQSAMDLIQGASSGTSSWEACEIPIRSRNSDIHAVLWNSSNILADDGKTVIATIAQGQDVTELRKTEKALDSANKQLEILMHLTKNDFRKVALLLIITVATYIFLYDFVFRIVQGGFTIDNIFFGLAGLIAGILAIGIALIAVVKAVLNVMRKRGMAIPEMPQIFSTNDAESMAGGGDEPAPYLAQLLTRTEDGALGRIIIYLIIAEFGIFSSRTIAAATAQAGMTFFIIFMGACFIFIRLVYTDYLVGLKHFGVVFLLGLILSFILGHFWGGIPVETLFSLEYFGSDALVALITGISLSLFMSSK
ncbi:PAS domain S-box protein [Methanocalculus taiwanensis]|uniref:histidine kinase n=1 Tax=Methanocalculus taiwanensis TaxID=106207 RepID=A0ABD4TI32_9EURY|nr:PAS domain S-box protein [Methanocalculus taiwanensis]MCQ1537408.1 PAS domain S-box protein [Methanocalculus taiwanensis]